MTKQTPQTLDLTDPSSACLCNAMRKAARAVTQRYNHALAPCGLTATQFTLLTALNRTGPAPLTALAERLVTDRTTLTRNAAILEKAGLIAIRSGEDRRQRALTITAAGRRRLTRALPLWHAIQSSIADELGRKRSRNLLAGLSEVTLLELDEAKTAP
jgi:DNA-binding MarR family transcriptional regulator